tara:strand:- start:1 stop:1161 length:1161 start_codon:yes stop_codon:yes gene_type:complete
MVKKISILGSTGSIGLTTLKIIKKKKNFFNINLLSANKNFKLICNQINQYKPKYFLVNDLKIFKKVKKKYQKKDIQIINDIDQIKLNNSDITISAISGIAGLKPTINIIKSTKKLLIANKESIICGWNIIKKESKKYKTKIIPLDSEHFSIMKLLENEKFKNIKKIYLTASGGPFLNLNYKKFRRIKVKDAIFHPKWKMGKKISIDSSTLMNKMLELIEAQKLFNLPSNKLDIIIHPNSLVHAIIEFNNGLVKFLYHETSMIIPIANAIFPENLLIEKIYDKPKKNIQNLYFQKVSTKVFPVYRLKNRINEYSSTSIIINAANEILVDQFIQKNIPFLSISKTIMKILNDRNYKKYAIRKPKNINEITKIDKWAREITLNKLNLND